MPGGSKLYGPLFIMCLLTPILILVWYNEKKEKEINMYCIKPLVRLNKEKKHIYKQYEKEFFSWKHCPFKQYINRYLKYNYCWLYPCGKCLNCINMKRYHWVKKLELEKKEWKYTLFLTITYNNENYPGQLKVSDIQNFIKYLRKTDKKIKYFCCGEYGGKTERAHYHLILFTNKDYNLDFVKQTKTGPLFECQEFNKCWLNKGYIWVAYDFNSASFAYVASYSNKNFLKQNQNRKYKQFLKEVYNLNQNKLLSGLDKYLLIDSYFIPNILFRKNEFLIMSKKPPIGAAYDKINKNVPSPLLKWKLKNVDIKEWDRYRKELTKRIDNYYEYLANNDIYNKIVDNQVLYDKKNWQNKKSGI